MNNRNGDLLDEDLQAVMGKDRCQNVWQPETKKSTPRKNAEQDKPKAAIAEPTDAEYVKLNLLSFSIIILYFLYRFCSFYYHINAESYCEATDSAACKGVEQRNVNVITTECMEQSRLQS